MTRSLVQNSTKQIGHWVPSKYWRSIDFAPCVLNLWTAKACLVLKVELRISQLWDSPKIAIAHRVITFASFRLHVVITILCYDCRSFETKVHHSVKDHPEQCWNAGKKVSHCKSIQTADAHDLGTSTNLRINCFKNESLQTRGENIPYVNVSWS